METHNERTLDRLPLPEVVGAPPGANAGGDSMRTVGDQIPVRNLIGLPEEATHNNNSPSMQITEHQPPVLRALSRNTTTTTQTGLPRQRIKWTPEMNKSVIRCYFIATKIETEMHVYRPQMRSLFLQQFPDLSRITEQNLADRKRAIMTKQLLTMPEIQEVKQQAEHHLTAHIQTEHTEQHEDLPAASIHESEADEAAENNTHSPSEVGEPTSNTNEDRENDPNPNTDVVSALRENFRAALTIYENSDPLLRDGIPRLYNNNKVNELAEMVNIHILPNYLPTATNIEQLHCLIYISAVAVVRTMGKRMLTGGRSPSQNSADTTPRWERRLTHKINKIRQELGRITAYASGVRSKQVIRRIKHIISPTPIRNLTSDLVTDIKDRKTQQLASYAKRLARFKKCRARKLQNQFFRRNQRQFYRQMEDPQAINNSTLPPMEQVVEFWKDVWSKPKSINLETAWIAEEDEDSCNFSEMLSTNITPDEVREAIRETSNWKSAGPDKVQNIWLKKLTTSHIYIAKFFTDLLVEPERIPTFLMTGNTFLISKGTNSSDPANFRPITCLSTTYKLLTKVITNRVYHHCTINNIITSEQKGCSRNSMGCKEQLTIDSVLVHQALQSKRNISMGYIDYKKAFDSLPHPYLLQILKTYRIDSNVIRFMEIGMQKWSVRLHLGPNSSPPIPIKCGIFQGDAFSPLWFCLGMNPLSKMLRKLSIGFSLKAETGNQQINHLLYVDDLKLYANNKDKLYRMIEQVKRFSDDIGMEFGIEKCKTIHIQKGKVLDDTDRFPIDDNNSIANLITGENYKYLGFTQLRGIANGEIKNRVRNQFDQRMRKILKSHLNAGNKRRAINTWAIPVLTYSFGIVKWSVTDLDQISTSIRTNLSKHLCLHPRSAVERCSLPNEDGGRGLLDIPNLHYSQVSKLRDYFREQIDSSDMIRTVCLADKNYTPLNLREEEFQVPSNVNSKEELIGIWKAKTLHGVHPGQMYQSHIDLINSNLWLKSGYLFGETEGFMIAIQDKVIATRNYRKFILKENLTSDACRRCNNHPETIDHIIGGCSLLAGVDYTVRHNQVAQIVHQMLAKKHKLISEIVPYYKYEPLSVLENNTAKLYWDRSIITDRTIRANKPDIVLFDKTANVINLFDIAIPLNNNMLTTYSTKVGKYTELADEMRMMYQVERVSITPIIISATGLIPKSLLEHLKQHSLESALQTMQKSVILNTCNIVRRFLQTNSN